MVQLHADQAVDRAQDVHLGLLGVGRELLVLGLLVEPQGHREGVHQRHGAAVGGGRAVEVDPDGVEEDVPHVLGLRPEEVLLHQLPDVLPRARGRELGHVGGGGDLAGVVAGGVAEHLITDGGDVGGVVGELGAEEEGGALELVEDGGEVGLGAGLQGAVVGGEDAGDLEVEGLGTVALLRGLFRGVNHDLETKKNICVYSSILEPITKDN